MRGEDRYGLRRSFQLWYLLKQRTSLSRRLGTFSAARSSRRTLSEARGAAKARGGEGVAQLTDMKTRFGKDRSTMCG